MKTCLPVLFLLLAPLTQAQTPYSKVIYDPGSEITATAIAPTPGNGVLMIGEYNYQHSSVLFLDSTGTLVRTKTFQFINGGSEAHLRDVILTTDQQHVIVGQAFNANEGTYDAYCVKIDSTGDTLWTTGINTLLNDSYEAGSVIETIDSNYAVAGNRMGGGDLFLSLLDQQGNLLWSSSFSAAAGLIVSAVKQAPDSTFYIVGELGPQLSSPDGFLIHLASDGSLLSAMAYPEFVLNDLVIHPAGLFFFFTNEFNNSGLMKTDNTGTVAWAKSYYMAYYDEARPHIVSLSDDKLVLLKGSDYEGTATITDTAGTLVQAVSMQLNAQDLFETDDQGLLIAGYGPLYGIKSLLGQKHIGVIKTDSLFQSAECTWTTNNTGPDLFASAGPLPLSTASNDRIQRPLPMQPDTLEFLLSYNGCVDQFGGIDENNQNKLVVSPNPSTGIFQVQQEIPEAFRVVVYNAFGQAVYTANSDGVSATIDLTGNATGVYVCRVVYSDQRTLTGKLVIGE